MQAPATNSDPKQIKALSMPDYVPSTGQANVVESGRRLDSMSNLSPAESGKYRHGRPQHQRLSVRKLIVGKAPPTVRVKGTLAATLAAINVPPSTPPMSPVHRLLELPHLPKYLEHLSLSIRLAGCINVADHIASVTSIARSSRKCIPRIFFTYVYLFELRIEKFAGNPHHVFSINGVFSSLLGKHATCMFILPFCRCLHNRLRTRGPFHDTTTN